MQCNKVSQKQKCPIRSFSTVAVFWFFSPSKGYEQGYKWFCRATLSSLGILNSLNTNVHYINYMACSLCATNYDAWFIMSCATRGICAAELHSPADIIVLSLLSLFPSHPASAGPISQIAAGDWLRSDWLGNVGKKPNKHSLLIW